MFNWWHLIYVYSFYISHMVAGIYWPCHPFSILLMFVTTFFKEVLQIYFVWLSTLTVSILLICHIVKLMTAIIAYMIYSDYCMVLLIFEFLLNIVKSIHAVVLSAEFDYRLIFFTHDRDKKIKFRLMVVFLYAIKQETCWIISSHLCFDM